MENKDKIDIISERIDILNYHIGLLNENISKGYQNKEGMPSFFDLMQEAERKKQALIQKKSSLENQG